MQKVKPHGQHKFAFTNLDKLAHGHGVRTYPGSHNLASRNFSQMLLESSPQLLHGFLDA